MKVKIMSKVSAQTIFAVFQSYDAGTRSAQLRKVGLKQVEAAVAAGYMNDAQFDAFIAHSKKPTGKVAMLQVAKATDFIASGDVDSIDKATAAYAVMCFLIGETKKPQSFENARFTLRGSGTNENARPVDGINGASLRKAVGSITNMGTLCAQTSRSIGANGSLGIFGITEKHGKHDFIVKAGARDNPFLLAYCKALSKLPQGVLIAKFEELNK